MKLSNLTRLTQYIEKLRNSQAVNPQLTNDFTPTKFLNHPFLQAVYNLAEPTVSLNMTRQKIYFDDGGHVALDWSQKISPNLNPPILFIMHGLTGGSQMNYIRTLMREAIKEQFQCVCMNSRGINTEMTSPIPFTAIQHNQLRAALERVQIDYPNSPIYLVGTSFGGNYLIRYLLKETRPSIKALIALAPPLDVRQVVDDMTPIYQRFFTRRYIYDTVSKHPQMNYWQKIGLVNLKHVYQSTSLRQFHERITVKILGLQNVDQLFHQYQITGDMISKLSMKTLFMTSKDDPIVSYKSMPVHAIQNNPNIKFMATQKGGHLCWFTGVVPKRWYPKPTLDYLKNIHQQILAQENKF